MGFGPFVQTVPEQGQFVLQSFPGGLEHPFFGLAHIVEAVRLIPPPGANHFASRFQAVGKRVGFVGWPGGGMNLGFGQIGTGILGNGHGDFAFGGQDEGNGTFDFAGGQLLLTGRQKKGHLESGGKTAEVEGGHGPELGVLNEGPEVFTQTPDEPQTTTDPCFAPIQKAADGGGCQAVAIGQFLNQSGFFPQGDGPAPGIERQHQSFGLFKFDLKDPDGRLCCALGLQNDQAFKSVDDFQLAIQTRHGQRFQDVIRKPAGHIPGRIAFEPLQAGPELFKRQVFQFHIFLFCPILRFDLLRFLGQKRTNTGARFRTNCVPAF
jgi:hypothetical protein